MSTTAWLQGLNAPDLGLRFENGEHFAATQDMTEEVRQEVSYQGAFGTEGPVLRQLRAADEGTLTFTAILLKQGVADGMNDELELKKMRDFEVMTQRGTLTSRYPGCNWTRISIRSTLDSVTLDCDISIPGYTR